VRRWLVASLVGLAPTLDRGVTVSTVAAAGLLRFETLGRHMDENWRHFGAPAEIEAEAGAAGLVATLHEQGSDGNIALRVSLSSGPIS
jgi:hypothetical protein